MGIDGLDMARTPLREENSMVVVAAGPDSVRA
jgi:hypothetical protein